MTRSRLYKPLLLLVALALLGSVFFTQRSLNRQRTALGFTRVTPLKNAPPVLVLTTVVLGSFRGLIANALWVRAMELQEQDKFFEMVQLADWITKLQPHINTVWIVMAWNMSYNISIKFSDPRDRWMWVQRGIELLRDEAIQYNPREALLYRELAWHFQHKMGHNLDDAHNFFKGAWANEMQNVLGGGHPDWTQLLNPQTDEARRRVATLRDRYKLDPAKMKQVDDLYGPLEWRLPEAHALYWAMLGKELARKKEDIIQLRRVIYQSMQWACRRGRLIQSRAGPGFRYGPQLELVDKANQAYLDVIAEDEQYRDSIERAHRNFLLDMIYFCYINNRPREGERWLKVIAQKYPKDYPPELTLEEYALRRIGEDVGETDMDRTTSNIYGVLEQSYLELIDGEEDRFLGMQALAKNIWGRYMSKITRGPSATRVGLPPLEELKTDVLRRLLYDPEHALIPEAAAILKSTLGNAVPPPPPAAPSGSPTPAPAPPGSTNAPAAPNP